MKKVLVPLADGFEEIEAATIIDVLRRADLSVTVSGISGKSQSGAHGLVFGCDKTLDEALQDSYDALVLPGGQPGVDNLKADSKVIALVQKMKAEAKLIGAICAAPVVLGEAGVIANLKFTCYPSFETSIRDAHYEQTSVVVDGPIITSRGPGTAMTFALTLVEILCGKKVADGLSQGMIVASS